MNLFILTIVLALSLFLTQKAAGTLNPAKMNIPLATMYLFYLQQYFGALLVSSGHLSHYVHYRLNDSTIYTNETTWVVAIVALLLPLSILCFNKLIDRLLKRSDRSYCTYLNDEVLAPRNDKYSYALISVSTIILIALLVSFLCKIGYVPLFKIVTGKSGFNYAIERQRINALYIVHPIFRNLILLLGIPLASYVVFSYFLVSRKLKWGVLFLLLFVSSLITKTYNFEKAPIVFHLAIYFFIFINYKGGISFRKALWFFGGGVLIIITMYASLTELPLISMLDIYNGPLGRTVFTPYGGIALNLDLFPKYLPFLEGRSLPNSLLWIVGFTKSDQIRSARLLMEYYAPENVYSGTAGVFSTLFVGEAYANFGPVGLILSIIWVGLVLSVCFNIMLKTKKNVANITFAAYFTMSLAITSQGGFVDFLFNANWLFVALVLFVVYNLNSRENQIRRLA